MKPDDHAREHVDGKRQPGPLVHRLPRRLIDKEDIDLGVVDLYDLERPGSAYCPGTAFVALRPFASLRFKETVRRSMRSTRALIVRRSGSGRPYCAQRALTCSIRNVIVGRSGFK